MISIHKSLLETIYHYKHRSDRIIETRCKINRGYLTILGMWDFRFSRRRVWSLESFWMQQRVVTLKLTDVSQVRTASIIHRPWWWVQYAPLKRRSILTWLHRATSQKTLNFIWGISAPEEGRHELRDVKLQIISTAHVLTVSNIKETCHIFVRTGSEHWLDNETVVRAACGITSRVCDPRRCTCTSQTRRACFAEVRFNYSNLSTPGGGRGGCENDTRSLSSVWGRCSELSPHRVCSLPSVL
jgi:hypothetical protein